MKEWISMKAKKDQKFDIAKQIRSQSWKWKKCHNETFPPFPDLSFVSLPCPWSRPQIWLEGLRSIVSSHWCGQSAANKRFLVHFWVKNHALHDSTIAKVVRQSDMHCYSYWSCNILVWYFSKSNCTVPLSALTIAYNRNITMRGPVSKKVERLRP